MGRQFHVPGADVDYWEPTGWTNADAADAPGALVPRGRPAEAGRHAGYGRGPTCPRSRRRSSASIPIPTRRWASASARCTTGTSAMFGGRCDADGGCRRRPSHRLHERGEPASRRATSRRREIAIRVAIGAGRMRLIRQLLTESLSSRAAPACSASSSRGSRWRSWQRARAAGLPRLDQIAIDGRVLVVRRRIGDRDGAHLRSGASIPERAASTAPLKDGGRTATSDGARLRRALIAAEVALSVVLLVGAGLLIRSFLRLQSVDPGVNATQALSFKVTVPDRYDNDDKVARYFSEAVNRLRSLPGVTAAGATGKLPLEGYSWTGDLFVEGRPDVWGRDLRHKSHHPRIPRCRRYPLDRRPRLWNRRHRNRAGCGMVNQTLARRFFGDTPAVGQRIAFNRPSTRTVWTTIVGDRRRRKAGCAGGAGAAGGVRRRTRRTREMRCR